MGYQSTVLKALGFFSFLCMNGLPRDPDETDSGEDNSLETETNIEASEGKSSGGGVAAGILIPLFIIICVVVLIVVKRKYFS